LIEEWRDIEGYEGYYQISNLGRVKSLPRYSFQNHWLNERILNQQDNKKGYMYVDLYNTDSFSKKFYIHRLVAQAFIPNPLNLPKINHKDEKPSNNFVDNLEWCTQKYNCNYGDHSIKQSISRKNKTLGKDNYASKRVICTTTNKIFDCIREASDYYNIPKSRNAISGCCVGKHKYIGKLEDGTPLVWMYYEDYLKNKDKEENTIENKNTTI